MALTKRFFVQLLAVTLYFIWLVFFAGKPAG